MREDGWMDNLWVFQLFHNLFVEICHRIFCGQGYSLIQFFQGHRVHPLNTLIVFFLSCHMAKNCSTSQHEEVITSFAASCHCITHFVCSRSDRKRVVRFHLVLKGFQTKNCDYKKRCSAVKSRASLIFCCHIAVNSKTRTVKSLEIRGFQMCRITPTQWWREVYL